MKRRNLVMRLGWEEFEEEDVEISWKILELMGGRDGEFSFVKCLWILKTTIDILVDKVKEELNE